MTHSSSTFSKLYPDGDAEWYACDSSGHVAVFTTAAFGPVPHIVLSSQPATDAITKIVKSMPIRGPAAILIRLSHPWEYIQFAESGFFAYDWRDMHRIPSGRQHHYEMISRPEIPVHVSELPEPMQSLVSQTVFPNLYFADSLKIDVRAYFDCEPAA